MRYFTVVLTLIICHGIHVAVCQTDGSLPDDDSSRREADTAFDGLFGTMSIYRTVISTNPTDRDLQTCCSKDASIPGLDFLFLIGRHVYGLLRWAADTIFDKFTGGGGASVKIAQTEPLVGEQPTLHGTHALPGSARWELNHAEDSLLSKVPKFEATPRQVICKCGRQRGCQQKPEMDGPDLGSKSLVKIVSKHLPHPLIWVGLGMLAGCLFAFLCEVTQFAVKRTLQKQTVKEMTPYIVHAMKESNLFPEVTTATSTTTLRRQRLQPRNRRRLATKHMRPRPSSDMDSNNLLETRPSEPACSPTSFAHAANRTEGDSTESVTLALDSSDKEMDRSETEQEVSSIQLHSDDTHPRSPASLSLGEFRSSEEETRQEVSEVKDPTPTDLAGFSSSSYVPDLQITLPLVDPVWPSEAQWLDSDDYSDAHSIHKIAVASNSKASLCSSLGDEMKGPWVSTSLSFIVYDLNIIDDIPDEVLEVLSCDEKPCSLHPHHRYHYFGRMVIVQRLPLLDKATSTTFIPSIELQMTSLAKAFAEERRAYSVEEQQGLDSGSSIQRQVSDDSQSRLELTIERIEYGDEGSQESDEEIDETDNTASAADTFFSIEDVENAGGNRNVKLETSGASLFTVTETEVARSSIEKSKKIAKKLLNKFGDAGSIVQALKEVMDFCTAVCDQQTAAGNVAQTELLSEHVEDTADERTKLPKTLPSMPLKSHDRSFSLEKVSAVKAALDQCSPDIGTPKQKSGMSSQLLSPFQETADARELKRSVLPGRLRPKICIPAARAASADFYRDDMKSVGRAGAFTCPEREALFTDLKEKVASRRLGESGVSPKDGQEHAPNWKNSDASLVGQNSVKSLSKELDCTRNFLNIRSAFQRISKENSPVEPASQRNMKDNDGLIPTKTSEMEKMREEEEQNITFIPFAFPVSSNDQKPPSSQGSSSHQSYEEFEAKPSISHSSMRTSSFTSFSRASVNEPSSPWEVPHRTKKAVFSPVAWSSRRSEVSSLFRATSSEKVDETCGQSPSVASSPRSTTSESPVKAPKQMDNKSSHVPSTRSSKMYGSDLNPKKKRSEDEREIMNKVRSVKADKTSVDRPIAFSAENEKNKPQIIEIPVVYKVPGASNKNYKIQPTDVYIDDFSDTLHQPHTVSKEKADQYDETALSRKRPIFSDDESKPEILLTGKPPLPRDSRTAPLQGSRHAAHNSLTGSSSKTSSPRSPRKDEEEKGRESCSDSLNDIDEELKRQIRDMAKTGRLLQDLIRKKSESNFKASKHKDADDCEFDRASPRPRTQTRLSSQNYSCRRSPRAHSGCDEKHRRCESSKESGVTSVYHEPFPTRNQDRSDSSQASSGYASVIDKDGPVIDILLPASADMLCSASPNQYLDHETTVVSTGSDAGDFIGQADVTQHRLSKIPILTSMREERRYTSKVKRKMIETTEEPKEEMENPARQSAVLGTEGHLFKPRGMEGGHACKMKTSLPDQPPPIANALDGRNQKGDISFKRDSFLTSPQKLSRTTHPKRVSPLIAQKIGLLKQSINSQSQGAQRKVENLYSYIDFDNFTDNASMTDASSFVDSDIAISGLSKHAPKVAKPRPVIVPRRRTCLPRLTKRVKSSPEEKNFSQNHIVGISSIFFLPTKEDLLQCPSPDFTSAGTMTRPSRVLTQDVDRTCLESPQVNVQAPWEYDEYGKRSKMDMVFCRPFTGETICKSLRNREVTERQQNTRQYDRMEELRQYSAPRGVSDTSISNENFSLKTTIRHSKSDSEVEHSSQSLSRAQVASFRSVSSQEKETCKSEASSSVCNCPLLSESFQSDIDVMEVFLPLDDSFLSEQCSLIDKANTPELISVIGSPLANSTVNEDDENIQMALQESNDSRKAVSDGTHDSPAVFEERHQIQTYDEDFELTVDNRGMIDTPAGAEEPQENGSSGQLLSSDGCANWSVYKPFNQPLVIEEDDLECDDAELPLAGSPDIIAALPGVATDLAMLSTERHGHPEQLDESEVGETLSCFSGHNALHHSRDLRIYGHSSFLEIGMAWLLQKTLTKISVRGDNVGILKISTFDTRIETIGKNASF